MWTIAGNFPGSSTGCFNTDALLQNLPMRPWYKFSLQASQRGHVDLPIDREAADHERTMGGYDTDDACRSKSDFFQRYFYGYQFNRLEYYDRFLRRHLRRGDEVLSLGSGRCANELLLLEDGYHITCSDMTTWNAYRETKVLFPQFEHIPLDILRGPSGKPYDTIMCLGLIYLFDERELYVFFRHVSQSLKIGGHLILDGAGSPDNRCPT